MLARLGCLFVLVPLLELALLIQVGRWIGLWSTLLLVVATGLAGAALARMEGLRAVTSVQRELARGRLPARSLLDGASILVGGAFLLTPGILTDFVGFALLLPPSRRLIQGWVMARLGRALARGTLRVTYWGGVGGTEGKQREETSGGDLRERERDSGPGGEEEPPPRSGEIVQE